MLQRNSLDKSNLEKMCKHQVNISPNLIIT